MSDTPEAGGNCLVCDGPFGDGDVILPAVVMLKSGLREAWEHIECQALGIVGHEYGVCSCTGFDHSRASALELWKRMQGGPGSCPPG